MIQNWLNTLRHYYIDALDPERTIVKLAFRTALACVLSLVFFQYFGTALLSTWAGFAAFAFVQNDTLELFLPRLYFLIGIILTFTVLTFLGMVISYHSVLFFVLSVPVIIFVCAYLSCLGFTYFNAAGWAMFLYIMAGSNAADTPYALQISGVFIVCGGISILVCFLVFPSSRSRRILLGYERVLVKLSLVLHIFQKNKNTSISKINFQLDHLLSLQEKNITTYLKITRLPENQKISLLNLGKTLYQVCLMTKSTIAFWKNFSKPQLYFADYSVAWTKIIEDMIKAILIQLKNKRLPDFSIAKNKLMSYRESLTEIRQLELNKSEPDFFIFLEYTRYFYHHIKLLELLETTSRVIDQLKGRDI